MSLYVLTEKQVHIILDFSWNRHKKYFNITSCLFARRASVGRQESDGSTFTLKAKFQMSFSKAMIVQLMLGFVSTLTLKSLNKYTNDYVSWACNESRHIALCYIPKHRFKVPEHAFLHWVTDIKYKWLDSKAEKYKGSFKKKKKKPWHPQLETAI